MVLALVRRWPGSTSKELAALAGVDRYTLARRLPELADDGRVEKTGMLKQYRWWPKETA